MEIKFNSILYELVGMPNVLPTHLQATILKGDFSFDDIVTDTRTVGDITVYDGEKVIAIYSNYTKRIAIVIHDNDDISIEFLNDDWQQQIDTISSELDMQTGHISNLEDSVVALNEGQDDQDIKLDTAEAQYIYTALMTDTLLEEE